jgi:hypothetical protein
MVITAPVLGFLPLRAARWETSNEPKPTRLTLSPRFKEFVTPSVKAVRALSAALFEIPALEAIALTKSAFVICLPPLLWFDEIKAFPFYQLRRILSRLKSISYSKISAFNV